MVARGRLHQRPKVYCVSANGWASAFRRYNDDYAFGQSQTLMSTLLAAVFTNGLDPYMSLDD